MKNMLLAFAIMVMSSVQLCANNNSYQKLQQSFLEAVDKGNPNVIDQMLKIYREINIDAKTPTLGWTALMLATMNGNKDVVELLLQKGANPDEINDMGATALHIVDNNPKIVELLIQADANVNALDDDKRTPLMYAAEGNDDAKVKALIDAGDNLSLIAHAGKTAFKIARKSGNKALAKTLKQAAEAA